MKMQNESGRTMLEMLGVLAIMGIITYGAIAGINYGMGSYKINQCYNEVQDIVRGIEDLYSWSKGYPFNAEEIITAGCKNDVFPECDNSHNNPRGIFGDISINLDNIEQLSNGRASDFKVVINLDDAGECSRLTGMDWNAANIKCSNPNNTPNHTCSCDPVGAGNSTISLHFSPK